MAKSKTKFALNDMVDCPFCGKKGRVIMVTDGAISMIDHLTELRWGVSAATGINMQVKVFADGCTENGKIGADHHKETAATGPQVETKNEARGEL